MPFINLQESFKKINPMTLSQFSDFTNHVLLNII